MLKIIDVAALYGTYRIMKCNDNGNGSSRIVFGLFVERAGMRRNVAKVLWTVGKFWENNYYIRI